MPVTDRFDNTFSPEMSRERLHLAPDFAEGDWPELVAFYKRRLAEGVSTWELDLTELRFIGSNSIGMLVALNTSVMANGGRLRLSLAESSPVTNQIRFARLDKILECHIA